MVHKHKAIFNWSGGKDSALCLHNILINKSFDIQFLFTTLNGKNKRISMHGVSENLLDMQAESIKLPLKKLYLPEYTSMEEYNAKMTETLQKLKSEGISHSVFGDIFLEDLRKYRENQLKKVGIHAAFPLWGQGTSNVAKTFINEGFKAIIVSVDSRYLDQSFAGRFYNESLLADLPENVDPCGENGEFHTFVFDGPIFKKPVLFKSGNTVYKSYKSPDKGKKDTDIGFWYCDLI